MFPLSSPGARQSDLLSRQHALEPRSDAHVICRLRLAFFLSRVTARKALIYLSEATHYTLARASPKLMELRIVIVSGQAIASCVSALKHLSGASFSLRADA